MDTRAERPELMDTDQVPAAERDLARGRDLFRQQFISQSALDALQGKVDSLQATLAADRAAVESARVSLRQKAIYAQVDGRVGAIAALGMRYGVCPAMRARGSRDGTPNGFST